MKSLKIVEFVAVTLTIVGSFLPWERAGGFLGSVTNGVRVDFVNFKYWLTGIHTFPVYDYGGVLVILFTSLIVLLAVQPPKFISNPILWNLVISAIFMISSLLFVGRWLIHWYEYSSSVEQPMLMIGLICVVIGSALFFWRALITYRGSTYNPPQKAG
jgi:hypothetical protein